MPFGTDIDNTVLDEFIRALSTKFLMAAIEEINEKAKVDKTRLYMAFCLSTCKKLEEGKDDQLFDDEAFATFRVHRTKLRKLAAAWNKMLRDENMLDVIVDAPDPG